MTWVAASLSAARTVPDWGGATVAALAEATRLANLDPLIGAHGSRGLFWTAVGVQTAPVLAVVAAVTWWCSARGQFGTAARSLARRRDVRDMVGRGAQRRAMQLRPSLQPAAAGGRAAGPGAARGWTRARWGCGWVGSAATTCTHPRKTCSWRSPGRGRTRPPPWWCPRCCPRSGRW